MLIAETFASLQGEGLLAGVPSFFIRTSGCNLRCAWCDTPYASWRPEGDLVAVDALIERTAAARLRHVVVTGGEPLLQRDIVALTRRLVDGGHHVTIETAGTVVPDVACHLLSISPKTANSDPAGGWRARHRATRLDRGPLRALLARHTEHQVKFVVRGLEDLDEIRLIVHDLAVAPDRVLLMPEGRTPDEVAAHRNAVAALCLANGFRYCPRLQVELWGGRRGA